jgi:hypothetical protein
MGLLFFQDGVSRSMVGLPGSRLVFLAVVAEDVKVCVIPRLVRMCVEYKLRRGVL